MDEPLSILVCEDSKEDEEKLLQILRDCGIPNCVTVFHSGEEMLEAYEPQTYDLLLSDIYMGGITGVEAVTRLRKIDDSLPVAFVTTSDEFALESYRLSALKYIEKPYQEQPVREILELARLKRDAAPALVIQKNGRQDVYPYDRIVCVEQQTHHVLICMKGKPPVEVYERLSNLAPDLEAHGFLFPHKSYAVNLRYVESVDRDLRCLVMAGGRNVPVRRESIARVQRAFENYLFNKTTGGTL